VILPPLHAPCRRAPALLLLALLLPGAAPDEEPDPRAEADALYEAFELKPAAALYEKLVASHPDDVDLRIRLADCLVRTDRFVPAIEQAEEAVARSQGAPEALAALGKALHREGDFDAARERLLEGIEKDPDCAECLWALARIQAIHGDYADAALRYQRAAALEPDNPIYLRSLAGFVTDRDRQKELYRRYLELPAREEERIRRNAEAWLAMLEYLGDRPLRRLEMPDAGTEVRIEEIRGMSYVPVRLGDSSKKLRYLFDTGASGLTVSRRMMKRLGLEPVYSFTITGIGGSGTAETTMVLVDRVRVGEAVIENVPAVVRDSLPGADGLLGPGVLGGSGFTLDLRGRRLRILGREPEAPDDPAGEKPEPEDEAVEVPFLSIGGTPFIPVRVDGVPMHAMIDTGASQAVLSPYAVEQVDGLELMAPGLAPPAYREIRGTTGKTLDSRVVRNARLEFAGLSVEMASHIPDPGRVIVSYDLTAFSHALETEVWAILGNPQFEDVVLTVDWGRRVVRVHPGR
jgi:predicted aspartyl protease/Flp pilus assembly protein TadD